MRLTETLLAVAVVLLASSDNFAVTASKATTTQDGLYADLYHVEDGAVTDKMHVPLGKVEQYKESDFKQLKGKLGADDEEMPIQKSYELPISFSRSWSVL
ncbi:hypothetical protein PHYSODRAFT_328480 [Phytophthora sojae]|uniref:RxLR effector protein n=1 Tax=Phytophthora sojae (strain P6497) TaxID=1094619 RepID=G4Z7F8_PHYSP|nr:hypothetical protein PHYSODRAFT_328480 [Phytophthora sojae]EGZ20361.1 hypothetical protein PHYSODRAFT_328480 [Phytophthora sojae]|eukprot:XP_009523078.1 hypothetical protein PHYSODRAFT_328480 [Phytophthora sojae]